MNYFLKKKKWLAWVIMLTFLFTSILPSNIMAGNSVAEAAGDIVAKIGDVGYTSIQEAIDAAKDDDTIVLQKKVQATKPTLKEVTLENVTIEDKTITIDTNGCVWESKHNDKDTGVASIITVKNSNLTLVGNGIISGAHVGTGYTSGNKGYRTITAYNTNLVIGDEDSNVGPTIQSHGTNFGIKEEEKKYGGVILVQGGSLTLHAGTITKGYVESLKNKDNKFVGGGGGVAVMGAPFIMNGGKINGNKTSAASDNSAYGAGVYLENSEFTMNGGEISENKNANSTTSSRKTAGMGIYATGTSIVTINGGEIKDNTKNQNKNNVDGGGIYAAKDVPVTVNGGTISGNVATNYGGGIYANGPVTINNGEIFGNKLIKPKSAAGSTYGDGGGIYVAANGTLTINGGTIFKNTSVRDGGGVYARQVVMAGGEVSGNTAGQNGGGIYMALNSNYSDSINGGNINNNTAVEQGGGIYATGSSGSLNLKDVTISGNSAKYGGGVAVNSGSKTGPTVTVAETALVYENIASGDTSIVGTDAHISDEFLFNQDSKITKVGLDLDATSLIAGATKHAVTVNKTNYVLVDGGQSFCGKSAKGYYNYQEIKLDKDDCISADTIILDPDQKSKHYVWVEASDGIDAHAESLTSSNGLCTTLGDAYQAAKDKKVSTITVCSPVTVTEADEQYLNSDITLVRCADNHEGPLLEINGSVNMTESHINGDSVISDSALVSVSGGATVTLNISGSTVIENGNNELGGHGGGIVINQGILNMTGGSIINNDVNDSAGIKGNSWGGGGIYVQDGTVNLDGGTISGNKSKNYGGGILAQNGATVKFGLNKGCTTVTGNTSVSQGGGICYAAGSSGVINKAVFTKNESLITNPQVSVSGGAISIEKNAEVKMQNVYMVDNKYTNDSYSVYGALYTCPTGQTAIFDINGAYIENAEDRGSAICASEPDTSKQGFFVSNIAPGGGEIAYGTYVNNQFVEAEPSKYQYTKESFTLRARASEKTKWLAEETAEESGVIITGNKGGSLGCAIANNGTLIIGTATKALKVSKVWADADNVDHSNDQVLVQLRYKDKDGVKHNVDKKTRKDAQVILSAENNWSYVWSNLGDNFEWDAVEANVTGYQSTVTEPTLSDEFEGIDADKYYTETISNIPSANSGSLTVSKEVIAEKIPSDEQFTFTAALPAVTDLLAYTITDKDGNKGDLQVIADNENIEVSLKNGEAFTIEGVPVGTEYTVTEAETDYQVYVNGNLTADGKIEGKISSEDANVKLQYQNIEAVALKLVKDYVGGEYDTTLPDSDKGARFTLTAGDEVVEFARQGNVYATTSGALRYDVLYTFSEHAPEGYTPMADRYLKLEKDTDSNDLVVKEYDKNKDEIAVYQVRNGVVKLETVKNPISNNKMKLFGEKSWVGGQIDSAITITLFKDGVSTGRTTQTSIDYDWKYCFDDLQRVNPDTGKPYVYTVAETPVDGYTTYYGNVTDKNGDLQINIVNVKKILDIGPMGNIAVTKKTNKDDYTTKYDFNLFVKAMKDISSELSQEQQRTQTLLATALGNAKTKLESMVSLDEQRQELFVEKTFLTHTSASAYQFFVTEAGTRSAKLAVTTGSAITIESVDMELEKVGQPNESWAKFADTVKEIVTIVEQMAEDFADAVAGKAEKDLPARPTTETMLKTIADNVTVTSGSAIVFEEDNLVGMFDAMVAHKQAIVEYTNAEDAWKAFKESLTTPSAIVLIVNEDYENPITLSPNSGTLNETTGLLEFDVITTANRGDTATVAEKVYYDSDKEQYIIPFTLVKDGKIDFHLEATTGSMIQYFMEEDSSVMNGANYEGTDITTYIYYGNNLADTLKTENTLKMGDWATLTSSSAYEFYNRYGSSTDPTEPTKPTEPTTPDEVIEDPDVPLTEPEEPGEEIGIEDPDVPLIDVPGEEVELEEPEVPLGDAPRTGDNSSAIPFVVLMLAAACGLAVTKRKFN